MSASLINDFADSRKQARIFKQRLPDLNAVLIELTRFPHTRRYSLVTLPISS